MTIHELQKLAYSIAKANGFHERDKNKAVVWNDPARVPALLMLSVSELAEALEAFRRNDPANFIEELADTIIRICDTAETLNMNLEHAIIKKCKRNKVRGYKHGGKRI